MNKCHYCKTGEDLVVNGELAIGCATICFPADGRTCDRFASAMLVALENQMGAVVGNKFICTGCNAFIGAAKPPHFSKKKKKKKCQPVCFKIGEQPVQQTKKRKPKKVTRYRVVIVEISYGEL